MKKILPLVILLFAMASCSANKTIYVDSSLADCDDISGEKCLKVKEAPEDDWTLIQNEIEGFDYREGNNYKIKVSIDKIKNPPADGSTLKYKLVSVMHQEKKQDKQDPASLNGKWQITNITDMDDLQVLPTMVLDVATKKVSGNAGCNNYGASYTEDQGKLTFGPVISTKMYCSNMKVETAFFECLAKATHYLIKDNRLTVFDANDKVLFKCNPLQE